MTAQPRSDHMRIARQVAQAMMRDDGVRAVLVHGSVVRGAHRPDSDLDLFAVVDEQAMRPPRHRQSEGIDVELLAGTSYEWEARLDRDQATWVYAWVEAYSLDDPDGIGASLINRARQRLDTYRTPEAVRTDLFEWWLHVAPKLAASLDRTALEAGVAAAISLDKIIETLFAVNDRPNPPAASTPRRLDLIADLTTPADVQTLFATAVTGTAHERAHACLTLIDQVLPLLQTTGIGPGQPTAADRSRSTRRTRQPPTPG